METSTTAGAPESSGNTTSVPALRWWPAAMLLITAVALRFSMSLVESPSLALMMAAFMGPAAISMVALGWWAFASRAAWRERLLGLAGILCIAVAGVALSDMSMRGMSTVVYQIPTGIGLFVLTLCLTANRPESRLRVALLAAALGFGVWDLVRLHGMTGRFAAEFGWRWNPTAEEEYLQSIASSSPKPGESSESEVGEKSEEVTRATAEWPDFRGPRRDGRQTGIVVASDWETTRPRELWKTRIGPGWGSFVVAGKRLFTQEQRGEQEAIVCLDADTGKQVWVHEYPGRFWEAIAGAGPRATPTLGDDALYSLGANGQMVCLNPRNGELRWKRDLAADSGCKPPMWGFSSSPLLIEGAVVVHAGSATGKGAVVAYDAESGDVRWKVEAGNHSYSSAQAATFAEQTGALMATNAGIQFLSPKDGSTLWQHDWLIENYRALQPLVSENSVLIGSSIGGGTRKITIAREGEDWKLDEDWTSKDLKPDYNDFVEYQGYLYGFDGDIFSCVDMATGKRQWKKGRFGNGQVLLLADAGQLLIVSEAGEIVLCDADPGQLKILGKIQAIAGKTWNHPVVVGDRLYVRNGEEAACFVLPRRATEAAP